MSSPSNLGFSHCYSAEAIATRNKASNRRRKWIGALKSMDGPLPGIESGSAGLWQFASERSLYGMEVDGGICSPASCYAGGSGRNERAKPSSSQNTVSR